MKKHKTGGDRVRGRWGWGEEEEGWRQEGEKEEMSGGGGKRGSCVTFRVHWAYDPISRLCT
jgi:hypothetical protein